MRICERCGTHSRGGARGSIDQTGCPFCGHGKGQYVPTKAEEKELARIEFDGDAFYDAARVAQSLTDSPTDDQLARMDGLFQ